VGALADADLVDRVYAFVAPLVVGGASARTPVEGAGVATISDALELNDVRVERFGDDILIVGDRPGRQPWDEET
jgi:diaminohydroxyphosphoribosylaminopyrimidine deaminase/5-amino-6-(5-phosphoribosylamino)uracil reductase